MRGIEHLHPKVRQKAEMLQKMCAERGLALLITDTLRTTAEQDALYAQGRTKPGNIVTQCKGSDYQSAHQWGVAFDFCRNVKGREYDDSDGFFKAVGTLGKELGFFWGGDFKGFTDKPHLELFEFMHNQSTATLKKTYGTPDKFMKTWSTVPAVTPSPSPSPSPSPTSVDGEKAIWDFLSGKGLNSFAISGVMGNLFAESGLKSNNLQNTYETKLGYTDVTYTSAVDSGKYSNFAKDSAGYGLAQWTYHTRKQALLDFAKDSKSSIGDLNMQLNFLWKELQGYSGVMSVLKNAKSVLEASNAILLQYEKPADQSLPVQEKRASYGQLYYDKFATKISIPAVTLKKGSSGPEVKTLQNYLNAQLGTGLAVDGSFGALTESAVIKFQTVRHLQADGIVGPKTWAVLVSGIK